MGKSMYYSDDYRFDSYTTNLNCLSNYVIRFFLLNIQKRSNITEIRTIDKEL